MMKKILCVNNDESVRELLRIILMRAGYECIEITSSQKALVILQTQTIDLIIQNLCRPGMDGCEFYNRIQQEQYIAAIPMLIITPLHPMDLPAPCQPLVTTLYPHNFVSMPFCPQTIITKIQSLLKPKSKSAHGASSPSPSPGVSLKMACLC